MSHVKRLKQVDSLHCRQLRLRTSLLNVQQSNCFIVELHTKGSVDTWSGICFGSSGELLMLCENLDEYMFGKEDLTHARAQMLLTNSGEQNSVSGA